MLTVANNKRLPQSHYPINHSNSGQFILTTDFVHQILHAKIKSNITNKSKLETVKTDVYEIRLANKRTHYTQMQI